MGSCRAEMKMHRDSQGRGFQLESSFTWCLSMLPSGRHCVDVSEAQFLPYVAHRLAVSAATTMPPGEVLEILAAVGNGSGWKLAPVRGSRAGAPRLCRAQLCALAAGSGPGGVGRRGLQAPRSVSEVSERSSSRRGPVAFCKHARLGIPTQRRSRKGRKKKKTHTGSCAAPTLGQVP